MKTGLRRVVTTAAVINASTENWLRFAKNRYFQLMLFIMLLLNTSLAENFRRFDRHAGRFTGFLISELYGVMAQTPQPDLRQSLGRS